MAASLKRRAGQKRVSSSNLTPCLFCTIHNLFNIVFGVEEAGVDGNSRPEVRITLREEGEREKG
jgi:hypothetical protein